MLKRINLLHCVFRLIERFLVNMGKILFGCLIWCFPMVIVNQLLLLTTQYNVTLIFLQIAVKTWTKARNPNYTWVILSEVCQKGTMLVFQSEVLINQFLSEKVFLSVNMIILQTLFTHTHSSCRAYFVLSTHYMLINTWINRSATQYKYRNGHSVPASFSGLSAHSSIMLACADRA